MAPRQDRLRFFVDESALGLGHVLAAARLDTVYCGHPLAPPGTEPGHLDAEWMPVVASAGLVAIGRDGKIRSRPWERAVIREHGLRVLRIGGRHDRDLPVWEWLTWLVRHWAAIERTVAERPAGPWFYLVNVSGLAEVDLSR